MKIAISLLCLLVATQASVYIPTPGFLMKTIKLRDNLEDYENEPDLARSMFKDVNGLGEKVVGKNDNGQDCQSFMYFFNKLDQTVCTYYAEMDLQEFNDITGACAQLNYLRIQIQEKKLC